MYILDTDHLSFIQRKNQAGQRILQRLAALKETEVAVTVITYEEQLRGRLRVVAGAKTVEEQVSAYHWLQQLALTGERMQSHGAKIRDCVVAIPKA
ncbi:MAG: hypothetical protein WBG32_06795 [Nodosilinea sp.]